MTMGRFKRYIKQLEVVKYTCSPALEGWLIIILSMMFAVLFGMIAIFQPNPDPVFLWLPWLFIFVFGSWGVYYVKFRRKPFNREVTLGGWSHRLWLRSKWMFIVVGLIVNFVVSIVGWSVCVISFEGYDVFVSEYYDKLRGWWILLFALSLNTIRQHIAYYQYYRSPEYRRRMESANEAAKHGTKY